MSFLKKLFNKKELTPKEQKKDLQMFLEEEDIEKLSEEGTTFENEVPENPIPDQEDEEYEIVEREILPAKIICPDCGGITLEGLDFCDKCGGELL